MAINLAAKYSDKVQERFSTDSVTAGSFSTDLDVEFTGVKTVKVYEVDTAPMNDYTRSGSNRYGTPAELADNIQEFVMSKDRSFTYTIDKGNTKEQFNIKAAATSLKRQIREVLMPEIDTYRIKVWCTNAGTAKGEANAPNKSNIGDMIMSGTVALDDALVPKENRTLYIPSRYYKFVKQCDEFTHSDTLTEKAIARGEVGTFDGMKVVSIASSYFPTDVYFVIAYKGAAISPVKLQDYKIHKDPPGISGDLVEGRVIYDAFVKGTKAKGIYVAAATSAVCVEPTISFSANVATMSSTTSGASIKYTVDGTDPRYSNTAVVYNNSNKPTIESGATVKAYAYKTDCMNSGIGSATNS